MEKRSIISSELLDGRNEVERLLGSRPVLLASLDSCPDIWTRELTLSWYEFVNVLEDDWTILGCGEEVSIEFLLDAWSSVDSSNDSDWVTEGVERTSLSDRSPVFTTVVLVVELSTILEAQMILLLVLLVGDVDIADLVS